MYTILYVIYYTILYYSILYYTICNILHACAWYIYIQHSTQITSVGIYIYTAQHTNHIGRYIYIYIYIGEDGGG